jgi:hypothetical protein
MVIEVMDCGDGCDSLRTRNNLPDCTDSALRLAHVPAALSLSE